MFFQVIKTGREEIGLVWDHKGEKIKIEKIYLPLAGCKMADRIMGDFPEIVKKPHGIPDGIDHLIAGLYEGKKIEFDLSLLNWSGLSDFSVTVLKQTFRIPRGKAATYSYLAAKAGSSGAARAAGSVMANNPFPLVIPCHRVVRADGSVGHFGGGSPMKEALLEKEGISFDSRRKIPVEDLLAAY